MTILKLTKTPCEICENTNYKTLPESVLYRQYRFITKKNLVSCSNCGEKYLLCANCGNLLTPVRISMSVFGVKTQCQVCGSEDKQLLKWVQDNLKKL